MKTKIIIILLILTALLLVSCKKKDSKLPDGSDPVTEFATISSFKAMFLELNKNESADLSSITLDDPVILVNDSLHATYVMGVLLADAEIAILMKNPGDLTRILTRLQDLTRKSRMEIVASDIRDKVLPLVAKAEWGRLADILYPMQSTIEKSLLEKKQYPSYSLLTLGEWSECTYRIATWVGKNFSTGRSLVLHQTPDWQNIQANLELIKAKAFMNSPGFKAAKQQTSQVVTILAEQTNGPLTVEQVERLAAATKGIRTAFIRSTDQ